MIRFGGTIALLALVASPAMAQSRERQQGRTQITPYIEASQVLTGDSGTGDVLTYTQVSAGIEGHTSTRRIEAQISYRYDRRIDWQHHNATDQIHSGLARFAVKAMPVLQFEGGALATRSITDARGATSASFSGSNTNLSQVYSAYVGPTLTAQQGPFGIAASYRFGATKVEAPSALGVPAGAQRLDVFDKSTSQLAQASIGTRPGQFLPVGLSISGAWQKENAGQLDQKYDGKFARGDIVLPISPTFAVAGGAGYEKITITQKDALLDVGGNPVTDSRGRFVTDPASTPKIAYNTNGLFWDAGVIWRPSRRTSAQLRVGRRYDSMSYTGSFSHQTSGGSGFQVGVYDSVQSFGRQLRDGIASVPTNFTTPLAGNDQITGCVFGSGNGQAGGCLGSAFSSGISTTNYRARGVDAVAVLVNGRTTIGFGAGYANRRYLAPPGANSVNNVTDESYTAQVFSTEQLGRTTNLSGSLWATYAKSGTPGSVDVLTTGASTAINHSFGPLATNLSLSVFRLDQQGVDANVATQAQAGIRYQF